MNQLWPVWLYNCCVVAMVAVCTASVAYFAQSAAGLLSLFGLFALAKISYSAGGEEQ